MSISFISTRVFIPHDEHIWVSGEVLSESDGVANVRIIDQDVYTSNNDTVSVSLSSFESKTLPRQNNNISENGVEDMCLLSYLHESSILDNLRRRFSNKSPYTFAGEICIAVNPYQWFDNYNLELR
jgi:myosin-5